MTAVGVGSNAAYGTVTIGATAGLVKAAWPQRKSIVVQNVHASNVLYLGDDSSVLTTSGLKIAAGESVKLDDFVGDVYGIASAAGTDVRFFEVRGS